MSDAPPDLVVGPGSLLTGRYRLERRIGRGGMADVYVAHDDTLRRRVAVKLFRIDAPDGDRLRIDAEMRILAGLRHPGLVTLYDANATGDETSGAAPYLVMEFIAGDTLHRRISSGPLPAVEVARLGAELAAALRYVHRTGVVHRDVKPANILLDAPADGGPAGAKLTDFGIARLTDGSRLTTAGTTVGTANYLSPEQATGKDITPASDVYSLALVLIECLTGRVAFPGSGVTAAVARLHHAPPVPDRFGPEWSNLLTAMTAREPSDRPTTAVVAHALSGLAGLRLADDSSAIVDPAPTAQDPPPWESAEPATVPSASGRPRRIYALAAAIALVIAAVVGVLVALSSGPDAPTSAPPAKSAPAYPRVAGQLGTDLVRLETKVAGDNSAMPMLQSDVRAVASAAARKDYSVARAALSTVGLDAAAAYAARTISDVTLLNIRAAATIVSGDLIAAQNAAGTTAAHSISAAPTRAPTRSASRSPVTAAPVAQTSAVVAPRSIVAPNPPAKKATKPHGKGHGKGKKKG